MVKGLLIGIILSASFVLFGQKRGEVQLVMIERRPLSYIQPGMLSASATLSPSAMLNRKMNNFNLSTFAAYRLDKHLSLRSDNYIFLNSLGEESFIDQGLRSYFGVFYHFGNDHYSNLDTYVGFQPGISVMKKTSEIEGEENEFVLSPSMAITLGTSFYVWKYFHFFANVSYANSKLGSVAGGPYRTDELYFSAGLGFQIQTKKSNYAGMPKKWD